MNPAELEADQKFEVVVVKGVINAARPANTFEYDETSKKYKK